MTISEMHTVFRVLNQQMGLHLVRGILSESIDVFLNMEIQDLINRELMQNAIVETQQNSNYESISVSSINTFSTLHCKQRINIQGSTGTNSTNIFVDLKIDPLFIIKASLEDDTSKIINARIVNPDLIETIVNDYCSAPDFKNPVITFCNYIEYGRESGYKCMIYSDNNCDYPMLILDYIKKPNKVDYNNKIDCDLPEHLHYSIVENAVKRFYGAMSASVSNNQQNVAKQ